jgi:hypothetical protein
MFSRFFIDRPIFAAVLSVFIVIAGLAAMRTLPIAQYPEILSSHAIFFSSTSIARLAVVNAFEFDAIANTVFSSTGELLPSSRVP